jgi:hypothetical protein
MSYPSADVMISAISETRIRQLFLNPLPTVVAPPGTRHPCGVGLASWWLAYRGIHSGKISTFRPSLTTHEHDYLIARLVMRFTTCLFATAVLLLPAVNGSPTSMLPSFLDPWSEGLNSLWWEPGLNANSTKLLGKRQSSGAFDHNPNGSEFLWILEDTYQGNTFFECVTV